MEDDEYEKKIRNQSAPIYELALDVVAKEVQNAVEVSKATSGKLSVSSAEDIKLKSAKKKKGLVSNYNTHKLVLGSNLLMFNKSVQKEKKQTKAKLSLDCLMPKN